MTILATANLNNHRGPKGQYDTLSAVADAGAQVIVTQEATWRLVLPGFKVFQPRRRDGSAAGEAVLVRKELGTRWPGAVLAADGHFSTAQHPLRDRFLAWWGVHAEVGWTRVLAVHRLPRDYPDQLRARMDSALAVNTRRSQWLAGGDFNDRLPAAHVVGEHVAGPRIDLWFASPALVGKVRPGRVIPFPDRDDDHPAVLLHLGE